MGPRRERYQVALKLLSKPSCTHEAGSTRAVGRQDVGLNALRPTDLVHAMADATETAEERRSTVNAMG